MPNKTQCDFCAFKLIEDQSTDEKDRLVEKKYEVLRQLKGVPKIIRHMYAGNVYNPENNRTETCVINSKLWVKNKTSVYCKDRIDNNISLNEALALRESRKSNYFVIIATMIATILSIIAIIISIILFSMQTVRDNGSDSKIIIKSFISNTNDDRKSAGDIKNKSLLFSISCFKE